MKVTSMEKAFHCSSRIFAFLHQVVSDTFHVLATVLAFRYHVLTLTPKDEEDFLVEIIFSSPASNSLSGFWVVVILPLIHLLEGV